MTTFIFYLHSYLSFTETKAVPKEYTVEEWQHWKTVIIIISALVGIILFVAALCYRKRVSKLINSCRGKI